jgi:hypothetical protein
MGVRIDKTGKYNASAEIELSSASSHSKAFDFAAGAYGDDAVFADEQSAIAYDFQIFQVSTAAGNSTPQSKKLRATGDEQVGHGGNLDSNFGENEIPVRN